MQSLLLSCTHIMDPLLRQWSMLLPETFSAIKTRVQRRAPLRVQCERKIDAICIFMRCLENFVIFGAKHSSPHSNEGEPFLTFGSSYSLTRKLNAQRETHFSAINLCECFTKIVAAPLMSLHSFLSPCAHGPFFHFRNQQYHSVCIVCILLPRAELFSLSLPLRICGKWGGKIFCHYSLASRGPFSSGRVCARWL